MKKGYFNHIENFDITPNVPTKVIKFDFGQVYRSSAAFLNKTFSSEVNIEEEYGSVEKGRRVEEDHIGLISPEVLLNNSIKITLLPGGYTFWTRPCLFPESISGKPVHPILRIYGQELFAVERRIEKGEFHGIHLDTYEFDFTLCDILIPGNRYVDLYINQFFAITKDPRSLDKLKLTFILGIFHAPAEFAFPTLPFDRCYRIRTILEKKKGMNDETKC